MTRGDPLHLRVFLSSPGDVAEERRIAREVIDAVARQPLLKGRVSFEVITYDDPDSPAPMSATETPQSSVNRYSGRPSDCDLTIALLWSRLGTPLPADVTREDGTRYESGTVWELEDAQQASKAIWIYRRTEEPVIRLKDPEYEKKRNAYEAVEAFFQRFVNPDGSLASGFNAYANPTAFGQLVEKHLEFFVGARLEAAREAGQAAQPQQALAPSSAQSWNWPRPWNFSGYVKEKRRGFVGRKWLFEEVRDWYGNTDGPQALLICADFGVGKSAFMAELASSSHGVPIGAHHFCHHDTTETLNPATFVRSVAAQLAHVLSDYKAAVENDPEARDWLDRAQGDPASAFERAVVSPLNAINAPAALLVLLVDALDESLDWEQSAGSVRVTTIVRLLAGRVKRMPAWLKVLATSRRRHEVLQPVQQAFRTATLNAENVRNLDDIRSYADARCSEPALSSVLAKGPLRGSEVAALLSDANQSGGKFLYAVRVLNDLESGALPTDRLKALPPGMDAFYFDAFERRFPEEDDYEPVRPLLGVLCVKREPMARADLAAAIGAPESQVRDALAKLEDFLISRSKRYAFDHLSLAQWLTEENDDGYPRAGRFTVDAGVAEGTISSWARREVAADRAHESEYLARHLGAHMTNEERRSAFPKLLFDFRWLDARLRAAGIDALLGDWADLEATPELSALERALRHAAHVLGHEGSDWNGADFLASQLLGRLQRRSESELVSLCERAEEHIRVRRGLRPLTPSLLASESLLRTLAGHTHGVTALALLADGRLASGSEDGTIKLWNTSSGACEATLEGHTLGVTALAALADGRLASGSTDAKIKLWNANSGACLATLEGHVGEVTALAALADGRLASGSEEGTIRLLNTSSGACEATFEQHTDSVSALAVLADGRLASGSTDAKIKLWNANSGACEATLEGRTGKVTALAVLADGRLASGSGFHTIQLWNTCSGACEATFEQHTDSVTALAALADGRLASGSGDGMIALWSASSGACEATLEEHSFGVTALAVLADGRLASGSADRTVKLWNSSSGACEEPVERHTDWVAALAVFADGRLASGSADRTIKLWNATSGACEATLEEHTSGVTALAVLADGRLAWGSRVYTLKLWNASSGACDETLEGHKGRITALAALANGRAATGSIDATIKLWNATSGACEATLEGHTDSVSALAVLADGRLASGSADSLIKLWNTSSGACEATLDGHVGEVTELTVLADGRLVSGSEGTIQLWNATSGTCEATLEGHTGWVSALAVLADGRLASGSVDKSIRIWEQSKGHWVSSVQFLTDATVSALAFLPRAATLAAGDESGRVHFLRIEGLAPITSDPRR